MENNQLILPRSSETTQKLTTALVLAQKSIPIIGKNKNVSFGGTSYAFADLPSTVEVIKECLNNNDITVEQSQGFGKEMIFIITRLTHATGEWTESYWFIPNPSPDEIGKKSFTKVWNGNTTTARRYALQAAVCTATAEEDDDNSEPTPKQHYNSSKMISDKQVGLLRMKLKDKPEWEPRLVSKYQRFENIPMDDFNAILELLAS